MSGKLRRRIAAAAAAAAPSLRPAASVRPVIERLEPRLLLDGSLVISELMAINNSVLADGDGQFEDWIEIHNPSADPVDLTGWHLSDESDDLTKWQFPPAAIGPGEQLVVFASDKHPNGPAGELHTNFKLKGDGEFLGLVRPDGNTVEFAYQPAYPPQIADVSYGLSADLAAEGYFTQPTPRQPNVGQPVEDPTRSVVINEIMYHPFVGQPRYDPEGPPDQNEREDYIELYNAGIEPVGMLGWQFSDGVDFTLPDVTLGVGEYLVVAADLEAFAGKYPEVTNAVGGWQGHLSNRGEQIELVDDAGRRIDRVRYADEGDWAVRELGPPDNGHQGWVWTAEHDGGGMSLELMNPQMSNNSGQNWAASTPEGSLPGGGTPGAVNSAAAEDMAPMIRDVAHRPAIPRAADPVTVTARLSDELAAGVTATLYYRVDGQPAFTPAAMVDDGTAGDGDAGDGTFGAVIPAMPDDTIVEFYVHAIDAAANGRTWPAPTQPSGEQLTNLLYQVDEGFDPDATWQPGSQPIYQLIMTEAERAELADIGDGGGGEQNSNAQMNGTFIGVTGTDTEVRYNVGIRNRGAGTRNDPPNNYRVNFPHDRSWKGVTAINVNSKYTHLQFVGSAIVRMAGLPAEDGAAVRVRVNGDDLAETGNVMYGSYAHMQVPDSDFADEQFPDDGDGNVYRCVTGTHNANLSYLGTDPQTYINTGYSKATNTGENDWTDLIHLTDVLTNAPDATYARDVAQVINVDQWLRWFALQTLIGNNETNLGNGRGDDYAMYRGVEDPRFLLLTHDLDTILGLGNSPANPTDSIFRAASTRVPVITRFLTHPAFVGRYYGQLKDLIATTFSPEQIDPLLDHALGGYVPATEITRMKQFVVARNAYVLSVIPESLSTGSNLPVVDGYPRTTSNGESLDGTFPAAETRSVLVGGQLAELTPIDGTWSVVGRPGNAVSDTLVAADAAVKYHVPAAGDDLTAWTAVGFNDDGWADAMLVDAAGVLVTEIATGDTRMVEIQNVSHAAVDTTGWAVLVNDASAAVPDINAVGSPAWDLPQSIAPGEVLYRTDDPGDNYLGGDILWDAEGPGWVMILDAGGGLMDFLAWGYGEAEIAAMSVDFGPFTNITVGQRWSGPGAEVGTTAGGQPITEGFVAFNDHIAGANTHANATSYAANSGGVSSGLLVDVTTGEDTGVRLTTSHVDASFGNSSSPPAAATDAFDIFNAYVDFAGGADASIQLSGADQYVHAFSGLDTSDVVTYDFAGTAIRGNSAYSNRWTLVTLTGAAGATPAHSGGTGIVVISPMEVALWTGHNSGAGQGFVAAWTDVDPGPDGQFAVVSSQYTGDTPLGAADGNKGYGLSAIRLKENAPVGPLSWLKRTGEVDADTAGDFVRDDQGSQGTENSEMTVPFGQLIPNAMGVGFSDSQPSFDAAIRTDVAGPMQQVNASIWLRTEFSIDDPSIYDTLTLRMRYDDGFIAHLNGTEIARRGADNPPAFDVTASAERPNDQAVLFTDIDVTAWLDVLQPGNNVLAIHGLNLTADDADLLIQAELTAEGGVPATGVFLQPGINRVIVQAFDGTGGSGAELQRDYIDLWYDPTGSPAQVIPGGDLSADLVLTAAEGPYHVTGDVTVLPGVTLTIMPGTTVFFDADAGITVEGRLVAEGTEYRRIRLTRLPSETAAWDGLAFTDSLQDSRLAYVDMQYGDGPGHSILVDHSQLLIDNVTWGPTNETVLELDHPSLIVRDSYFPPNGGAEVIHGENITGDEYLILDGNVFAASTSGGDVIDFLGAERPGPVFQVLNNAFLGGGDDAIDLDGTDAHVEGNVFMNFHLGSGRDTTSNAIATGLPQDGGANRTEITVVRNVFFDNDHAILLKEEAFATVVNNAFVGTDLGLIQFYELEGTSVRGPARGAYLDGNILVEMAGPIFKNVDYDPSDPGFTSELEMHRTLVPADRADDTVGSRPGTVMDLGIGNLAGDPRLADVTAAALRRLDRWAMLLPDPRGEDFSLLPGSPALGTGPGGLDMGAMVPAGASISGEPPEVTRQGDATLTIGGPGITHYRIRINDGPLSIELPVDTPVPLTGLPDGEYTVYAIGLNSAGVWQSEAEATASKTWTVDSTLARVRINEVLAINASTLEHEGAFPDLVELYNDGPSSVDLAGMSITDDRAQPAKFVFPADRPGETLIPAGGYLVLYADDRTEAAGLHLGFLLDGDGEGLFLFDAPASGGTLLDSVEFGPQVPDLSIGRVGHQQDWALTEPTLGAANAAARTGNPATLKINEWLASGEVLFDNDFLELYNPDPLPVALGGLYLSDDPFARPSKHQIAPLSFIAGGGFIALVADGDPQDGPHHLSFRLSAEQELLGLYTAELEAIDEVIYYWQTTDASEGRSPDGTDAYEFFTLPTPGTAGTDRTTVTVGAIGFDKLWSYEQSGNPPDAAWNQPEFAPDPAWPTGQGPLGLESSALPVPLVTDLTLGPVTFYFRTLFSVDADPRDVTLNMTTMLDDGAVFYLNGVEVRRLGIDSGAVPHDRLADRSVGNAVLEGPFPIPTNALLRGENLLAVEVHQTSTGSSDVVFAMSLDATVTTVEDDRLAMGRDLLAGLRITEIMYNPAGDDDTEFIELQNVGTTTLDLAGVRLDDGVQFTFPPLWLAPGQYVVVVRDTEAFEMRYGSSYNVAGEYSGSLSNDGEDLTLKLAAPLEAAVLRFDFSDSWYPATDGDGFALEIRDPAAAAASWDDAGSWQPGTIDGGTPGTADGVPTPTVVINEVLTHTDPPQKDTIELHNTTGDSIDVGGWYLSDSRANYQKFRIPGGTSIPAGGYVVFDEDDFNPTPDDPGPNDFALNGAYGDDVWLLQSDGDSNATRFVDHVEFGAAARGESFGRWPNGSGPLYPMLLPTLDKEYPENGPNSGPRVGPVVLSEVHYNPTPLENDDGLEFVEIYNPTVDTIPLANWRLDKGIDFDFPAVTLLPYSTLVVVGFDPGDAAALAAFRAAHGIDDSVTLLGPYSGRLSDGGEKVQLQRPDDPPPDEPWFVPRLLEDEVVYSSQAPWPAEAAGQGSSLHRAAADAWGNDPASWQALPPTPGTHGPGPDWSLVVGRYVFYNGSAFDGGRLGADAEDDDAIAPDKTALLPGQTATFANYTSFHYGINGIIVDVAGLPEGAVPQAEDFQFRVGNDNNPAAWVTAAAAPEVTVRPGEGLGGSDRVTLIWPNNLIQKQWLEVTVLSTAATGLRQADVFYYGNAIGESGNSASDAKVNVIDMLGARDNQRGFLNPAPIDFAYDFNRDTRVNTIDMLIARNNQTHFLNALQLITVPGPKAAGADTAKSELPPARGEVSPDELDWLYELDQQRTAAKHRSDHPAVDRALATLGM